MDDTLVQLIKAMQDIAPQVWNIYLKQVMVDGIQVGIAGGLLTIITILGFEYRRRNPAVFEYSDDLETALYYILFVVCGLVAFLLFSSVMGMMINPEYYAIQKLLGVISGN